MSPGTNENHHTLDNMADAKLQRTIQRFEAKIALGTYYEAHQTLRTIVNRYVKASQYNEALDLLNQGASILAENKQYAMASDLISYLIQIYVDAGIKSTDHTRKAQLIQLISALPDTENSLIDLSRQAIEWSLSDSNKFGDCELHHVFGMKLLNLIKHSPVSPEGSIKSEEEKQKLFSIVELHLILGTYDSIPAYVDYLFEWWQQTKTADAGVFIGRAILNYAYLRNIKFLQDARDRFMAKLQQQVPDYEQVDLVTYFAKHPLANFFQLLTLLLQKEKNLSSSKFLKLYGQYKTQLQNSELVAPVEYLGNTYFDLKLGNTGSNLNMLANMMGGLFS